jgi:hypothetical protein
MFFFVIYKTRPYLFGVRGSHSLVKMIFGKWNNFERVNTEMKIRVYRSKFNPIGISKNQKLHPK